MQVRDLREKLDTIEDDMRRKDDELARLMDGERSRPAVSNTEKKEWEDSQAEFQARLADAQDQNESLKGQIDRMRDDMERMTMDKETEVGDLRRQLEQARNAAQQAPMSKTSAEANRELLAENQELRMELQEQQRITKDVRREAQQSLREMKQLVEQSGGNWEKQAQMEKTIEQLEQEVRDWRGRYVRTKTQLRNMHASSLGLTIEQDASKCLKEKGFAEEGGLVKDVHVTKFQIAIDEFLRGARVDNPEKVTETMKGVVFSVRRITKDIDGSTPKNEELAQQRAKLKSRVSSTANSLITASRNYASSAGISPVSILDAAASHLVAAVIELLRMAKIRATPAGELEDDDTTITPVDSSSFFSPRSTVHTDTAPTTSSSAPAPPPPFQGLRGFRVSAQSSAYSLENSPRESVEAYSARQSNRRSELGLNGGYIKARQTLSSGSAGPNPAQEVSDHLDTVKDSIQNLVSSIRDQEAPIGKINDEIEAIGNIIGRVTQTMENSGNGGNILHNLQELRQRLFEAAEQGRDLAAQGRNSSDREWSMWKNTLPPIAFGIAREMKELVQQVEQNDDFS